MRTKRSNITILLILWVLTVGAGTYLTFFTQPEKLVAIDEAEKALHLERTAFRDLALLESKMRQEIQFATHRWRARYKNVEDTLSTADVIDYVNRFAEQGFTTFNAEYSGLHSGENHQYFAFNVRGTGPFTHLYDFVWHMENNRDLYRIENLVIDHQSSDSSNDVQFTFRLVAYFGTSAAISATAVSRSILTNAGAEAIEMPIVPDDVLPVRKLPIDPFDARTRQVEPDRGGQSPVERVGYSLRTAQLVSIVGSVAVFSRNAEMRKVQLGDNVREGEVIRIDAGGQRVTVETPEGSMIHFDMEMEPLYRRVAGSRTAVPVG